MEIGPRDALIIVDVQNDFCPGGALAVADGDEVVPLLNRYARRFDDAGALVVATRDWHPADHISFQAQGGIWPVHCVQESEGADFHPELSLPEGTLVISKGDESAVEAYSGFMNTDLAEQLRARGVERVFVGGLATDYCVKETVLDALKNGFESYLLADAARGVEVKAGDVAAAEAAMVDAGARRTTMQEFE